jgi:hypothetical protein
VSARRPHSEFRVEHERYVTLSDRRACDDILSEEETDFCRSFELRYPKACLELASFAELSNLHAVPDASSRALVDRALAQIEAEDAARAFDEIKLLRHSRRPGLPAIVGAIGLAVAGAYALIGRTTQSGLPMPAPTTLARAELVYASGNVKVSGASGAAGRTLLTEGCVVETAAEGGACVLIDSDINLCLAPNSRMRLTSILPPARRIDLEAGSLATRLSTQPEGMSLTIAADGVASTAVGTAFSVQRGSSGLGSAPSVVTTVLNGKVRVGRLDQREGTSVQMSQPMIVSAHERAVTSSSGTVTPPVVTAVRRTEEAPSWALLGPTVLWHDPVAATLEVHGEPAGAEAWLDDQWLGVAPISSLIPVGEHQLVVRKDNRDLLVRELRVHAGDARDVRYEGEQRAANDDEDRSTVPHSRRRSERRSESVARAPQPKAVEVPETDVAPDNGADLLRQARQAVRAGQFRAAAMLYERLVKSRPGSDEAQTALVLLGQLRLNQLQDPQGALSALDSYLKRGGSNEVEARVARIEALRALHRTADEVRAIEDFLRDHPRSFEGKPLRARLSVLRPTAATAP